MYHRSADGTQCRRFPLRVLSTRVATSANPPAWRPSAWRSTRSAQVVKRFSFARDLLRNALAKQAGADPDQVDTGNPDHAPVFYLDGEAHRRKRSAIARLFTPTAVTTRYRAVMERATDTLLARLKAAGEARLDALSLELAVAVAAEIVGLTNSDCTSMASRIGATLASLPSRSRRLARLLRPLLFRYHALNFFYRDVRPAIEARRRTRREDLISQLLDEGYSNKAIMIECMTYAVAGMVTTREFIVMAAWHLFERDGLRARFLAGDEADQLAILDEILRLEPVAAVLQRRAAEDMANRLGNGSRRDAARDRHSCRQHATNRPPAPVRTRWIRIARSDRKRPAAISASATAVTAARARRWRCTRREYSSIDCCASPASGSSASRRSAGTICS